MILPFQTRSEVHNLRFHLGMVVQGKLTTGIGFIINHAGKAESSPGVVVDLQLRSIDYYREPVRGKWSLSEGVIGKREEAQ